MKRKLGALLPLLVILNACNKEQPVAEAPKQEEPAAPVAANEPVLPPPTAGEVRLSNDLVEFQYSYPSEAAAIPSLKAWLDEDLAKRRVALMADARAARADAQANDYPFRPYGLGHDWQVVTQLSGWLSLSATVYSDTGGAHPNHWFDALLWDKNAEARRDALDLFVSKAGFSDALRRPFCAALDKERAERRGAPVDPASGDGFDECIDPAEQTVILGSSNRLAFDRIGILVSPYAAGPYAEGSYEITLPVTARVMAALRPQYRSAFAIAR